jgi:hypothetical protein
MLEIGTDPPFWRSCFKMAERETEHPRWLPTVNRDYDPIL